jgi:hypothetical protein
MDLIGMILGLPLAPLRGVVRVVQIVYDEAEREYHDPVRLRRQLADIDRAMASGELPEAEGRQVQQDILDRMVSYPKLTGADPDRGER